MAETEAKATSEASEASASVDVVFEVRRQRYSVSRELPLFSASWLSRVLSTTDRPLFQHSRTEDGAVQVS